MVSRGFSIRGAAALLLPSLPLVLVACTSGEQVESRLRVTTTEIARPIVLLELTGLT
jgi:hypothetical protein